MLNLLTTIFLDIDVNKNNYHSVNLVLSPFFFDLGDNKQNFNYAHDITVIINFLTVARLLFLSHGFLQRLSHINKSSLECVIIRLISF